MTDIEEARARLEADIRRTTTQMTVVYVADLEAILDHDADMTKAAYLPPHETVCSCGATDNGDCRTTDDELRAEAGGLRAALAKVTAELAEAERDAEEWQAIHDDASNLYDQVTQSAIDERARAERAEAERDAAVKKLRDRELHRSEAEEAMSEVVAAMRGSLDGPNLRVSTPFRRHRA